jgi:hypothetical protein
MPGVTDNESDGPDRMVRGAEPRGADRRPWAQIAAGGVDVGRQIGPAQSVRVRLLPDVRRSAWLVSRARPATGQSRSQRLDLPGGRPGAGTEYG